LDDLDALHEDQFKKLQFEINDAAVCKYASRLNGGRGCSVEHAAGMYDSILRGVNYHARIRFHDGSVPWLIRVRREAFKSSVNGNTELDYEVMSEYATLKFLETTAVPAPRAFGYGLRGGGPGADHGVGVSFLLIEEPQGRPWYGGADPPEGEETKLKEANLFRNLADILAELARHPFPQAGSLGLFGAPGNSAVEVSAQAGDRFGAIDPDGPFETSVDYYTAWAERMSNPCCSLHLSGCLGRRIRSRDSNLAPQ
jgi:hypothetical protein